MTPPRLPRPRRKAAVVPLPGAGFQVLPLRRLAHVATTCDPESSRPALELRVRLAYKKMFEQQLPPAHKFMFAELASNGKFLGKQVCQQRLWTAPVSSQNWTAPASSQNSDSPRKQHKNRRASASSSEIGQPTGIGIAFQTDTDTLKREI